MWIGNLAVGCYTLVGLEQSSTPSLQHCLLHTIAVATVVECRTDGYDPCSSVTFVTFVYFKCTLKCHNRAIGDHWASHAYESELFQPFPGTPIEQQAPTNPPILKTYSTKVHIAYHSEATTNRMPITCRAADESHLTDAIAKIEGRWRLLALVIRALRNER
jgi:hypothetical protein